MKEQTALNKKGKAAKDDAIREALQKEPELSNAALGKRFGVNRNYIAKMRAQLGLPTSSAKAAQL